MKPAKDTVTARRDLFAEMERGELSMVDTIRRARRIMGLNQKKYAALVGLSPRVLIDFERGAGNPTLDTLEKIGRPFGFEVAYRHRARPTN
ncbi:MAG: hypothetical protein A2289_13365 [Deltaproteobacteria bacterium RIFOXYA12_FULL_58_15]|nr:MAG: hypothetical protein A2289_13365 [Deltaproteobacteria bacterium RIFOXYA12_FULL_58_15]OGR13950.1 MAG: hypothetical protein A2341_04470 [Deltaproteobacteria bacterium RIFOXYB12_FULL_58_9]